MQKSYANQRAFLTTWSLMLVGMMVMPQPLLAAPLSRPQAIDDAIGDSVIIKESKHLHTEGLTLWAVTTWLTPRADPLYFLVDVRGQVFLSEVSCPNEGTIEETKTGWRFSYQNSLTDCQLTPTKTIPPKLEKKERKWYEVNPQLAQRLAKALKLPEAKTRELIILGVTGGRVVFWFKGGKQLWLADAKTGIIDTQMTELANSILRASSYADCMNYLKDESLLNEPDEMHCYAGGTALVDDYCLIGDDGLPECDSEVGRPYSPAQLEDPDVQQQLSKESCAWESRSILALTEAVTKTKALCDGKDWGNALNEFRAAITSLKAPDGEHVDDRCHDSTDDIILHRSVDLWAEFLNNFGYALYRAGDLRQALVLLEMTEAFVKESGRSRPVVYLNLGETRCALGDKARAQQDFRTFLAAPITPKQRKVAESELKSCLAKP